MKEGKVRGERGEGKEEVKEGKGKEKIGEKLTILHEKKMEKG